MSQPKAKIPQAPAIRWKGALQFVHHLFKLEVAAKKQNTSWKLYEPKFEDLEHVHFFHSCDDKSGNPNKYTTPACGHFHEMKLIDAGDENTPPTYECGPAIKREEAKGRKPSRIVPLKYALDKDDRTMDVTDSHTHKVQYRHSELISQAERAAKVEQTKRDVSAMFQAAPGAPKAQGEPAAPSDVTIEETERA